MKLATLLQQLTNVELPDKLADLSVSTVVNDSRQIVSGSVFIAEQGISSHGLDYLTAEQCELLSAVIYQPPYDCKSFEKYSDKFIAVKNLQQKTGQIAKRFYSPQFDSSLIAVTGTNGKTSVSHFIAQLADYAVVGTMGYGRPDQLTELSHTTPDALSVQKILSTLSQTTSGVAMEVSSHALSLNRVDAVDFAIAVFTNLSQDHLDFHADMADYMAAKAKLFAFDSVKTAIVNVDDEQGYGLARRLQKDARVTVIAYGQLPRVTTFERYAQLSHLVLSNTGIAVNLAFCLTETQQRVALFTPIWGEFNAYNVVAAMLALVAAGESMEVLLQKARNISGVTGRIDPIALGNERTAIVDYAHTPDALVSVLQSIRQQVSGRIYTVFGCGGDRDKSKRPLMAEAVNRYSDFGIITDDNPRTEKSAAIIADILTADIEPVRFQTIPSRREAIRFGLSRLHAGDVLLIAGKGHETYQIIGTEKHDFSDHQVVREWLDENV